MEIFINECSLNNQYTDNYAFINAVKVFISSIKLIAEIKKEKEVYRSGYFFYYTGIQGTHLETSLKSDPSINWLFVENLKLVNPKPWEVTKVHDSSSSYKYAGVDYVGTSVSEIAERALSIENMKGFLLNFKDSQFLNKVQIDILKNDDNIIIVDCAYDPNSINTWLIEKEIINPDDEYDEDSDLAPLDMQTVLNDGTLFELTTYPKNNGRRVYRRIGTDELWVVDSSKRHAGEKAHIEIFDEISRDHMATSIYNEVKPETKYAVANRHIDLG